MDQIRLTGIRATGKHGVLDFEHERAQTFVVDATLFLDLAAAGRSDDLNDTVDLWCDRQRHRGHHRRRTRRFD